MTQATAPRTRELVVYRGVPPPPDLRPPFEAVLLIDEVPVNVAGIEATRTLGRRIELRRGDAVLKLNTDEVGVLYASFTALLATMKR